MITQAEKKQLLNHLAIYNRQKFNLSVRIEECKAQIEELTAQQEIYPDDDLLQMELIATQKLLSNLENNYQSTLNKISGVEWLLQP